MTDLFETNLLAFYTDAVCTAINRGARYIQLDKIYMIEYWGSVNKGLEFYHTILARLSVELKLKFYVSTIPNEPMKFSVYWEHLDGS